MKSKYIVIPEARNGKGEVTVGYGIAAIDTSGNVVARVKDVTVNERKANELASLCERLGLSPIHLCEVVEDYIVES